MTPREFTLMALDQFKHTDDSARTKVWLEGFAAGLNASGKFDDDVLNTAHEAIREMLELEFNHGSC